MLDHFLFNQVKIVAFVLVFLRILSFFIAWQLFVSVPVMLKILISIVLSIVIFPVVPHKIGENINIVWFVIKELSFGFLIGFISYFFFFAVSIAGKAISYSIGLGNAQIFNPQDFNQGDSSPLEYFLYILAALFFFSVSAHHFVLKAIVDSFTILPISSTYWSLGGMKDLALFLSNVFAIGVKISLPVIATIFLVNTALAAISRAIPQFNTFIYILTN